MKSLLSAIAIGLLILTGSVHGSQTDAAATHKTPNAGNKRVDLGEDLSESITAALQTEQRNVLALTQDLSRARLRAGAIATDLNAIKLHLSSIGNQSMLPTSTPDLLDQMLQENEQKIATIDQYMAELAQEIENGTQIKLAAQEQIAFNNKQASEIQASQLPADAKGNIVAGIEDLLSVLNTKLDLIVTIQDMHAQGYQQLKNLLADSRAIREKIEQRHKEIRMKYLFQRTANPLLTISQGRLAAEADTLFNRLDRFATSEYWREQLQGVWRTRGLLNITYLILFLMLMGIVFRIKYHAANFLKQLKTGDTPWREFFVAMWNRTIVLAGMTLIFFLVSKTAVFGTTADFFDLLFSILLALLATRWFTVAIRRGGDKALFYFPPKLAQHAILLVRLVRIFAVLYAVLLWLLGSAALLPLLVRILFEVCLLVWCIGLSRLLGTDTAKAEAVQNTAAKITRFVWLGGAYLIALVGFSLEMAGFASLAQYWFYGWGGSLVIGLWGYLSFKMLKEWDQPFHKGQEVVQGILKRRAFPVRWMLFRISWLAWGLGVVVLLLICWGGRGVVLATVDSTLKYEMTIGNIKLSLAGFFFAAVIIFCTHIVARLWRHVLRRYLLERSGMEPGLRASIATINVYLVWTAGILIALHAFGLNTASLALAFGALGIGLGFGLQNIFNNFISGIIMLIERPIQVGDAVEVGGIWGEVKKINIRSTVVQTYDNASLIIPNSEFISSKVTNWSFKDQRLRRALPIGVAYGSDVELVRQTLLEIADTTANVLKYPKPDVIFIAHGDSTLNFKLRYWTNLDYYFTTETDIRFAIERLFRERGIEIAFPQRDIHIKTIEASAGEHLGPSQPKEA